MALAFTSLASDLSKEKRWAEQIEDALLDGEPVTLNDGVNDFFAIDTTAENPNSTAIILLHGIGVPRLATSYQSSARRTTGKRLAHTFIATPCFAK